MLEFFIFSLILSAISAVPLSPSKVLYAIDSGATVSTKSASGFLYQKDEGFSASRVADYSNNQDVAHNNIKYTLDQNIYLTERHHDQSFAYEIPVLKEDVFREPGKRVFNIKFGEKIVIKDLDIVANVGPFAANDEYIEFELKEDQIFYGKEPCLKAFKPKSQKLVVIFEKTDRDLPIVSGLVLYRGGLSETDFGDLPEFRNQWQEKIDAKIREEEEERMNRLNQKRKIMDSLGEAVFEFEESNEGRMTSILRILLSKEGAVIVGILLSCAVLLMIFDRESAKEKNF